MHGKLLILAFTVTGYISICDFTSSLAIPIEVTSSAITFKICAVAAALKNYNLISKKRKKNTHYKIVLLAKFKINSIEILLSMGLIDSNISHNQIVLVNTVLKQYDDTK